LDSDKTACAFATTSRGRVLAALDVRYTLKERLDAGGVHPMLRQVI
jgi:hypothetical protein